MSEKLKNFKTDLPCTCCGHQQENENCLHHLLTKKVFQEFQYESWNLIPVCQRCHNEFHSKGTSWMAVKFPRVKEWLEDKGWSICPSSKKWRPDGF